MKRQYGLQIMFLLWIAGLAFLGGFFLGRNISGSYVIISTVPTSSTAPPSAPSVPDQASSAVPTQTAPVWPININTATAEQLDALPGIGPVLAQRIVDYRQANGPFASVADLAQVEGIGPKRLEAILDYITTGG